MTRSTRTWMLVLGLGAAVVIAGCSTATTTPPSLPGDSCNAPGTLKCGSDGTSDAVLRCQLADGTLTWAIETICAGTCTGVSCDQAGDTTLPDGTEQDEKIPSEVVDTLPDFLCSGPDCGTVFDDILLPDGGCKTFLTPCNGNSECCEPGLCVDSPEGNRVCTKRCEEDCPDGWRCLLYGYPDVQSICLAPNLNKLCKPCVDDMSCNLVGDMCLPMGIENALFCSRDCSEEACPPGYECKDVTSSKGETGKQCWPISEVCECLGMVPSDYLTDKENCGTCGKVCQFDNAEAFCEEGNCKMGACLGDYKDLNQSWEDGCEYICIFSPEPDMPDMQNLDTNCDGIDGDKAYAIFVSPNGMDTGNQTGNIEHPVKTIAKGIALASAKAPKWDVYIAAGTYLEQVIVAPGVSLYGGFNAELGWTHDPTQHKTIIRWNGSGPGGVIAMLARDVQAETLIDGLTIEAGDNDAAGGSSTAVHIFNSTEKLKFSNNHLISGNGGNGLSGNPGTDGTQGSDGGAGQSGCEYDGAALSMGCGKCSLPPAGTGAAGKCGNAGGNGGAGGNFDANGKAGQAAQDGAGGGGGGSVTGNGAGGSTGTPGTSGTDGVGGNGRGTVDGNGYWVPSVGGDGSGGTKGAGGGGGGGGGGEADDVFLGWECYTYGAGGGGGGSGGCAGTPGSGGGGGGGSFGVFVVNSQPVIEANIITYRFGGNGGKGGKGGAGGNGGPGGPGGQGNKEGENEGGGGNGGAGGKAGSSGGGGGGSGGVSFGIFWSGSVSPTCHNNDFYGEGSGGAGGGGGNPNATSNGKTGDGGDIYNQSMNCIKD